MLELFFIERGLLLVRAPVITNKIKNKQTNKTAYQRPTPVLFVFQLLLLVRIPRRAAARAHFLVINKGAGKFYLSFDAR